jgi:cyclopropane fatty-acyl-phospholipid synthase-like methyltransferase
VTTERYADGRYRDRNPTWHLEDSPWKAQHVLAMMRRHRVEPRSVCEIGCGAGEILRRLHDALPEETIFIGYEPSPQAYALARTRETARLRFSNGDVLRDEPRAFDLVLLIDVIEHLEDYFPLLRFARDRAGHTILHIPLDLSVQSVLRRGRLLKERDDVGHLHYFTRDVALRILSEAGLDPLEWCYTASAVQGPARSWKSSLARWPRRLLFALAPDLACRLLGGYSLLVLAAPRGDH